MQNSRKLLISRRARLFVFGLLSAVVLGGAILIFANVPNDVFELDGNSAAFNSVPPRDDWDLLNGDGLTKDAGGNVGQAGFSILRTFVNQNPERFTQGGSKDPLDIDRWVWTTGSTPSKDTITHGYAAVYDSGGHLILNFGADRYAVNGDANIGMWLFQGNVGPQDDHTFGPDRHQNGDLFVVSAFTKGGALPTISVYTWDSSCLRAVKSPVAGLPSGDSKGCADTNLRLKYASATNRTSCAGIDEACAITNSDPVPVSWQYAGKLRPPYPVPVNGLFEGGIDLTEVFGADGVPCISSFLLGTRSSQTTDAVLKDFVGGPLKFCGLTATKECTDAQGENAPINFNGSVRNDGVLPVTNLSVTDDQPGSVIDTLSKTTLLPGETATYTGHYIPTQTVGDKTDIITATANVGTRTVSTQRNPAICKIRHQPVIDVTKACDVNAPAPGLPITVHGTGNHQRHVTMNNVLTAVSPPV